MDDYSQSLINKWQTRHYFNAENDRYKNKKLIYNSFMRTNSFEFNPETIYSYIASDAYNRYLKMKGLNVLYLTGVNDLSNSSYLFAKKNNMDYLSTSKMFKENLDNLGLGYDSNYFLASSCKNLLSLSDDFFIRHFGKEINLVTKDIYTNEALNRYYNDFEIYFINDEAYSKYSDEPLVLNKVSSLTLKIDDIEEDIRKEIEKLDIDTCYKEEMLDTLQDYENAIISFNINKELHLDIELEQVELLAGISFIALNPSLMDVLPYIFEEEYDTCYKYMQNGYSDGVFSGYFAKNPLNYKDICIIISYNFDEAIHVGIPQINEKDYAFASEFGLDYNFVISNGKLINSGFLDSLSLIEARNKMLNVIKEEELGTIVKHFKTKEIIISNSMNSGAPIPLKTLNDKGYEVLEKEYLPIYLNRFNKIIFNKTPDINIELVNQTFNNIYQTSITKLYLQDENNYFESKDFASNINEVIYEEDILDEILFPIIFSIIDKQEYKKREYKILIDSKPSNNLINNINNLNINFISEALDKYKADDIRHYVLKHTKDTVYENMLYQLEASSIFLKDYYEKFSEGFAEDNFDLDNKIYNLVLSLDKYITALDMASFTKTLEFFFYKEFNLKKWTQNQSLIFTKLLSIVCPFITEKVFNEYFKSEDLLFEEWPTY